MHQHFVSAHQQITHAVRQAGNSPFKHIRAHPPAPLIGHTIGPRFLPPSPDGPLWLSLQAREGGSPIQLRSPQCDWFWCMCSLYRWVEVVGGGVAISLSLLPLFSRCSSVLGCWETRMSWDPCKDVHVARRQRSEGEGPIEGGWLSSVLGKGWGEGEADR